LIRVAMEMKNYYGEDERMDLIREVTRRYVQVKLLDQQITEVARKLEAETGPPEMRYELLMAKTALEAKRMTELADLRKVMGVVPRHPFDKHPIGTLNTLLHLDPLDQGVVVMDTQKPFVFWGVHQRQSGGLLSTSETLDYVRTKMSDKGNLPLHVIIYVAPERKEAAKDLASQVRALARELHVEYQTYIEMDPRTWVGTGAAPFILRDGEVYTFYPMPVQRPNAPNGRMLATGAVEPHELEAHISWRLTMPKNVPVTFAIEYDRGGFEQAQRIAEKVRRLAKQLKLAKLIDVKTTLVEPLPVSAFLGGWRAITPGEIRTIEIKPEGYADLDMNVPQRRDSEPTTVRAKWTPAMDRLYIDTKKLTTYKADFNEQGHLVLDRGQIYPQGSWNDEGGLPITFEKVPE